MVENENPTIEEMTSNETTAGEAVVEPQPVVEKIDVNEIKEELKHQEQEKLEEELKDFYDAFKDLVEAFKALTPEETEQIVEELKNKN